MGLCRYEQSLSVLKHAKLFKEGVVTKTSIMLGLGETDDEIKETMTDLRAIDVDIMTFGQYLQVSVIAIWLGSTLGCVACWIALDNLGTYVEKEQLVFIFLFQCNSKS